MRPLRALLLASLLALAAPLARAQDAPEKHVVLITIDGLRPDFYRSSDFETPTLRALIERGASARAVEPVFPSITYPGHASIVTGVRPARHGIVSNQRFDEHGAHPEWRWEAGELKAKTIWQAAHEQKRTVAITQWPTTVGAEVDWLVPERWGVRGESTRDLLLKMSTPGLLVELAFALGITDLGAGQTRDFAKIDDFVAGSCAHLLTSRKPSLSLCHLVEVDEAAHAHGRDAAEVKTAVTHVDACIGKIVDAAREAGMLDSTVFVVTGDHGFTDYTRILRPNVLLAEEGLVEVKDGKVESWRALGQAHGGSFAVHSKDRESAEKARARLERFSLEGQLYKIVDPEVAKSLGADPGVSIWVDGGEGVEFEGAVDGPFSVNVDHTRGTHGGLPTKRELQTGFVAAGPGIRRTTIDHMKLIDVAPTLAKLMGIEMKDTDGGVVRILEEEPD